MRREIPLIITLICGVVMMASFFIPHWPFAEMKSFFQRSYMVIAAFATLLGVMNLSKVHLQRIRGKSRQWGYSIVLLSALGSMSFFGLYFGIGKGSIFDYLFNNLYIPMSATMFSLLAFFVASASYRAFRARTVDAALLLAAGFIVMLGRVPIGATLTSFLPEGYRLPQLADWIMAVPNTAGQRAIMMGAALGVVATSLRIILGIERSYLGGE